MKVRGTKVAEYEYAGNSFAVIRMADPEEGTFVTPGSDQADAVLRLEAIAKQLDCTVEYIEEELSYLLELEEMRRKQIEYNLDRDREGAMLAKAIEEQAEIVDSLYPMKELIEVADDLGFQPVIVVCSAEVCSAEELAEFLK
jgi:hypothetical protein